MARSERRPRGGWGAENPKPLSGPGREATEAYHTGVWGVPRAELGITVISVSIYYNACDFWHLLEFPPMSHHHEASVTGGAIERNRAHTVAAGPRGRRRSTAL